MHCFNESAPFANIFDCMKGHNRKLNRLKVREFNGSGAVKRQDSFSRKLIGWGGAWRVGGGVSINLWVRLLRHHCSMQHSPFTPASKMHYRPRNWCVTSPSYSCAPSITCNHGGGRKVREWDERRQPIQSQTQGGGTYFITWMITRLIASQTSYSSFRKFIAVYKICTNPLNPVYWWVDKRAVEQLWW